MNRNLWSFWSFLLVFCSCEQGERVILRPVFTVRNSSTLEIDKIVLNDTATIFYIDAFFRPKNWILIDSGTYLKAGDQKIPIIGSKDIKLQDYHWIPESGKSSFQLIFPPLKKSIKEVDFIESDCKDCFKIYGIQLTPGGKTPDVTAVVPKALKDITQLAKSELPELDLKIGKTKLNIHILGYRKELGSEMVSFFVNDFITGNQSELITQLDEHGECQFEFGQYGTINGFIDIFNGPVSVLLAPGEEVDLYVDLVTLIQRYSPYHRHKVDAKPVVYSTGKYAAINTLRSLYCYDYLFQPNTLDFYKFVSGMNADQYVDFVRYEYTRLADSIQNSSNPEVIKTLNLINNKAQAMVAICNYQNVFQNISRYQEVEVKMPDLKEKHYQVLKELDLNDPELLYTQAFTFGYPNLYSIPDWKKVLGIQEGILVELEKIQDIAEGIKDLKPLTTQQEEQLKSIGNPFYLNAFQAMLQDLKEQQIANKAKEGYTICEVPVVANNQLFDAIIAAYPGKVVFVDFWATWCGPCRAAIRELEPAKMDELKNDNIVFVYLTGDSSPLRTWQNMIPDIRGNHYRLNKEQWDAVCDKFGITGIPSYVLVDKAGNYQLRKDLRDHYKLKKVLLEEAGK